MKQVIRLNESQLRQIVKQSVKKVLNEDVAMHKEIHEVPNVQVKQSIKYHGRDPKGVLYNVYVDGAPMFRAVMNYSEYEPNNWNWQRIRQRGNYDEITVYFTNVYEPHPTDSLKNNLAFRKSVGLGKLSDLNIRQGQENVSKMISRWASFHVNDNFASIVDKSNKGGFTVESAPYLIKRFVEGLLAPQESNKVKSTDEVTVYDFYDDEEKTMTIEEAYKYAASVYRDICSQGYGHLVAPPNKYHSVEGCLIQYAEALRKINEDNYEPEDWYERNEHGDFDTY